MQQVFQEWKSKDSLKDKIRIHIHCAKPGIVIGRGGTEIEKLRQKLEKNDGQTGCC